MDDDDDYSDMDEEEMEEIEVDVEEEAEVEPEEEEEDDGDDDQEDQEDDDDDEEEEEDDDEDDPMDRIPSLDDVDASGRPLRPRQYPPMPDNIEVPDYATNDPSSILRRSLQEVASQQRVIISHRQIEKTIECFMKIPGAMKRGTDEQGMKRFLFGWESVVWRKKLLSQAETRSFVKTLVMLSVEEMNKTMIKSGGQLITMREPSGDEVDKFVVDIMPILLEWVSRP